LQAVILPDPPNHGYINEHSIIIKHPSIHATSTLYVSSPNAHPKTQESAALLPQPFTCYIDATTAIQPKPLLMPGHSSQTSKEPHFNFEKAARVPKIFGSSRSPHLLACSVGAEKISLNPKGGTGSSAELLHHVVLTMYFP
jgi:hypothetical protein